VQTALRAIAVNDPRDGKPQMTQIGTQMATDDAERFAALICAHLRSDLCSLWILSLAKPIDIDSYKRVGTKQNFGV
jgi:hypothetical protein